MTLCDQWDGVERVTADRLDGLFALGDAVDGEQAEGQLAQGGHGSGAVAVVGLLVALTPDGVAEPVLQILDFQCRRVRAEISAAVRSARLGPRTPAGQCEAVRSSRLERETCKPLVERIHRENRCSRLNSEPQVRETLLPALPDACREEKLAPHLTETTSLRYERRSSTRVASRSTARTSFALRGPPASRIRPGPFPALRVADHIAARTCKPPSTGSSMPVTYEDSSQARNSAVLAMS